MAARTGEFERRDCADPTDHTDHTNPTETEAKAKAKAKVEGKPSTTTIKAHRCAQCRRKLTLAMQIPCNCGYNFCAAHRAYEDHPCSYDYRGEARATLHKRLSETGTTCKRTAFGLDAMS